MNEDEITHYLIYAREGCLLRRQKQPLLFTAEDAGKPKTDKTSQKSYGERTGQRMSGGDTGAAKQGIKRQPFGVLVESRK